MGYCTAKELMASMERAREADTGGKVSGYSPFRGIAEAVSHNNPLPYIKVRGEAWAGDFEWADGPLDFDTVSSWLNSFHTTLFSGTFVGWKCFRPWEVVDLYSDLDQDKVWIGWEVETSWASSFDRAGAMRTLLTNYNHVCVDPEGGYHGLEMTWAPKEIDFYDEENKHPLLFAAGLGYQREEHSPYDMVGTHINISTPSVREASQIVYESVCSALNNSLSTLTDSEREKFFGREDLYGGFFIRGNGYSEGSTKWYEGKLFNSTYDADIAEGYIEVGNRLANLAETIADTLTKQNSGLLKLENYYGTVVDNLAAVLKDGVTPIISIGTQYVPTDGGDLDRGNREDDGYDDYLCGEPACEECY